MKTALSVNLNKVALLRNSRTDNNPSLQEFAEICIAAGANGLTAHPRPDQRHIRASDINVLAQISRQAGLEFNIEGNPFAEARGAYPGFMALVREARPDQCTLVPDTDQQLTSDHGFDLFRDDERLAPFVRELRSLGVRVSVFMDPIPEQIERVAKLGADRIELYTGPFAEAYARSPEEGRSVFEQHRRAADTAHNLGLGINAGHDLNLDNLPLYAQLPNLAEVSIGHALTADALRMGFEQSVKAYLAILR